MRLLNYTGRRIGLQDENGTPVEILPIDGYAHLEKLDCPPSNYFKNVPIYRKSFGKVINLPKPDLNFNTLYLVNKEVAEEAGNARFDLVIGEDPISIMVKSFTND